MKSLAVGLILLSGLGSGVVGYKLAKTDDLTSTTTKTTVVTTACASLRKEERKIIDMYTFLLSREEIRLEEDRRSLEREFHDKLAEIVTSSEKRDCP